MRIIIITGFIIFAYFLSFAQEITIIPDPLETDEMIRDVKELPNGDFLMLKSSGPNAFTYYEYLKKLKSTILLTNSSFQEIKSAVISSGNENIKILAEGILQVDGQILLHGNALDTITMDTQLCLILLDQDFNMIHIKYYGIDNQEEIFLCYCINSNDNYVFSGKYPLFSQNQKLVFIEVGKDGTFINSAHTDEPIYWESQIVFFEKNMSYSISDWHHIYSYDMDFNLTASIQPALYNYFYPWGKGVKINDSLCFRTGTAAGTTYPYSNEISRVVFNEAGEYFDEYQIVIPEYVDIPSAKVAISTIDTTLFFLGGTSNSTGIAFVSKDTRFVLQKYDLEGNIYWENLYETGGNAVMMEVLALQDGGCLMAGQIWNWHQSSTQQRDLIFIKVNGDGIVTGIEDNEPTTAKINVYPNPGTNRLNISEHEDILRFTLYDFNGGKVLEYFSPPPTIDVSHLKRGFYFWRAGLNDGTMRSGKWIKR